jgi:hypothetical protein
LLGLFFDPEDGGDYVPPKRRLTFNKLHGIISQKIVLWFKVLFRPSFLVTELLSYSPSTPDSQALLKMPHGWSRLMCSSDIVTLLDYLTYYFLILITVILFLRVLSSGIQ